MAASLSIWAYVKHNFCIGDIAKNPGDRMSEGEFSGMYPTATDAVLSAFAPD